MEILQKQNDTNGEFYIELDGVKIGAINYSLDQNKNMIIEHTEVGPELAGQGAGKKMLYKAIDYARTHQLKIIPTCSYAASVFAKTPEIQDII